MAKWIFGLIFLTQIIFASSAYASKIPKPDHIVIVVEENHAYSQIIGNDSEAPFMNFLAHEGALFTESYGITHPSQPNYLALFSGSTQDIKDDHCPPPGTPFHTPNLAEKLKAKGYTFLGYSEDLPYAGYTGCSVKQYVRKHAPWVNWSETAKLGVPFSSFPVNYNKLPTVSIVIPNLRDDIHSAPVAVGDNWLKINLARYIRWAKHHNSLFILTFDEDDNTPVNRIPTIFVGPMVKPGKYGEKINHYTILQTLKAMYGLHDNKLDDILPITNVWR